MENKNFEIYFQPPLALFAAQVVQDGFGKD